MLVGTLATALTRTMLAPLAWLRAALTRTTTEAATLAAALTRTATTTSLRSAASASFQSS